MKGPTNKEMEMKSAAIPRQNRRNDILFIAFLLIPIQLSIEARSDESNAILAIATVLIMTDLHISISSSALITANPYISVGNRIVVKSVQHPLINSVKSVIIPIGTIFLTITTTTIP